MPGSGQYANHEGCRDFVGNLVRMRDLARWSQQRLADEAHVSKGTVAMTESFQRMPQIDHGTAYDRAFGLTNTFEAKARAIHEGVSFPPSFRSFAEDERNATNLFIFEHSFVPGPFQTERYARAVLKRYPNVSDGVVEGRVKARLARREILTREEPPPPRIWALLDEGVLRRRMGDAATMHEQLMHLLALADLPNVTVQVIKGMEGHVGMLGAFTIAEAPGRPSIVNLEDIADGRVSRDPGVVDHVRLAFRAMQTEAQNVHDSRDLIATLAEGTWKVTAPAGVRALTAAPTAGSA